MPGMHAGFRIRFGVSFPNLCLTKAVARPIDLLVDFDAAGTTLHPIRGCSDRRGVTLSSVVSVWG